MSVARRRYAGRRVKDAIAVFEKNKGTIVFTADEAGQAPVKPSTSTQCGPSTAAPDPTVRAEGTNALPGGEGNTERPRSAKVGGWTKEKVYVLELTRDRVQAPGGREGLLPAPAVTSPTAIANQSQERKGDARENEAVGKKEANQGGERSRSGVADLLAEAQQLVEEVMLQGVASPHRLQTSCPTPDTCEQHLRADVWRLEMENASLRRKLDSVRQEEESCRAQLNDLHEAYFSLQQCLGRRVHRLQAAQRGKTTSEKTGHCKTLSRPASSQESCV